MHVEGVYALPDVQHRVHLELEEGARVSEALDAVRRTEPFNRLDLNRVEVGVFGRRVGSEELLQHGDRVELYRPLQLDPKEARRRRASCAGKGS